MEKSRWNKRVYFSWT